MGFAKNWLEELVSEWLSLEGYSVETNVPLKSKSGGGRNEADVLGFMFKGEGIEIVHAEATVQLTGSHEENIRKIREKFSQGNSEAVLNIAMIKYGGMRVDKKRNIFVSALPSSTNESEKLKAELSKTIEFINFQELIGKCTGAIKEYAEGEKIGSMDRPSAKIFAALPDSLWFMKMLGMFKMYPDFKIFGK